MPRQVLSVLALTMLHMLTVSPSAAQDEASGHTVSINGFQMYYETVGEGEPLFLEMALTFYKGDPLD